MTIAAAGPEVKVALPSAPILTGSAVPEKTFRDCEDEACPWMVVVPSGSFMMGSPESEPNRDSDEGPQHTVNVSKFAMGQFEVTQGQWKALIGSNPSTFSQCGDTCPVENVSWEMAQEYVKKLSEKTGQKYRLPSEAEWEYAARAGTTTPFYTGQTILSSQANFNSGYTYNGSVEGGYLQETVPVGGFKKNAFGLGDMQGNVWEWVQDCWHDTYLNAPAYGETWEAQCAESHRVLRGGSWYTSPRNLRSANRDRQYPFIQNLYIGFRVARSFED